MAAIGHRIAFAVLGFAGIVVAVSGVTAEPGGNDGAEREIAGLVEALGASDCEFQCNGRWHSAGEARAHLQRKLDRARKRGLSGTAEQFIERAASRSSVSGRAYRVRCADGYEGASADWFGRELRRLRQANSSQPPS